MTAGQLDALRQRRHASITCPATSRIQSRTLEVTAEAIGADQVWAGADDVPALTGHGRHRGGDRFGDRHAARRAGEPGASHTVDFTGGDGSDLFGHGTHVAGIIAGQTGRTADGRELPRHRVGRAIWSNLRVLGDDGSGYASDVIEAIDWAIEHRNEYNIRVINLSLGRAGAAAVSRRSDVRGGRARASTPASSSWRRRAITAGRTDGPAGDGDDHVAGQRSRTALTVGAIDTHGTAKRSDDTLAPYSSRGPTRYDLVLKPDLAAPGSAHRLARRRAVRILATTYSSRARDRRRYERVCSCRAPARRRQW